MSDPVQTALDLASADDDDGLVIIGVPRDAPGLQSHSPFRKIDMAAKAGPGKLVSFSWGDLMVMLPRPLYERAFAAVTRNGDTDRAAVVAAIIEEGIAALCSE